MRATPRRGAAEEFDKGNLTAVEKTSIDRKADKILHAAESVEGTCD